MKYTIHGFSQLVAMDLKLDDRDLMILRWFIDYKDTGKRVKRIIDGDMYYWIKYEGIREAFPIANWKKDTIYRRLKKLVSANVLKHKAVKQAGTYSFYAIGDNYLTLTDTTSEINPGGSDLNPKGTEINPEQNINLLYSSIKNKNNIYSRVAHDNASIDSEVNNSKANNNSKTNSNNSSIYKEIIDYLNSKADTNYKHTTKKTQSLINARLKESFTLEDFKAVIDIKTSTWKDTEMEKYLRPETLFGTKFESYLNEKEVKPKDKKTETRYQYDYFN